MAKSAFKADDTTTDIRNALQQERRIKGEFTAAIRDGARLHGRARACVEQLSTDLRKRQPLNLDIAKEVIQAMHESLTKNSNVLLWITNLQFPQESTACHSFNTAVLSMAFGRHRGMSRSDVIALGLGGLLHDLGKSHLPRKVLDKPATLTPEEWGAMRRHAVAGFDALSATGQLSEPVLKIVRHHHERADGSGYPDGLFGGSLPDPARMVAVVDAYDNMTGGYYRRPMTHTNALRVLKNDAAEEYGLDLVEEFIRCLGTYPVGSLVELNSGSVVMVVGSNPSARLKPMIMFVRNEEGRFEKPRMLNDLSRYSDEDLTARWGIRRLVDPIDYGIDVWNLILEEIQF